MHTGLLGIAWYYNVGRLVSIRCVAISAVLFTCRFVPVDAVWSAHADASWSPHCGLVSLRGLGGRPGAGTVFVPDSQLLSVPCDQEEGGLVLSVTGCCLSPVIRRAAWCCVLPAVVCPL